MKAKEWLLGAERNVETRQTKNGECWSPNLCRSLCLRGTESRLQKSPFLTVSTNAHCGPQPFSTLYISQCSVTPQRYLSACSLIIQFLLEACLNQGTPMHLRHQHALYGMHFLEHCEVHCPKELGRPYLGVHQRWPLTYFCFRQNLKTFPQNLRGAPVFSSQESKSITSCNCSRRNRRL